MSSNIVLYNDEQEKTQDEAQGSKLARYAVATYTSSTTGYAHLYIRVHAILFVQPVLRLLLR